MLDYNELQDVRRLKRLSLINAEKDYLQDLILLSTYSDLGKELLFKGGTCMYKLYGLGWFSEDLDFTCVGKISMEKLAGKIIHDLELFNIKGNLKSIDKYKNGVNVRMVFNGPLYMGGKETQCFIPLNISLRERNVLVPKKSTIKSFYREVPDFDLFSMDETEILAEKVRAILTRDKARDVYDLWFLLKKGFLINPEIVNKKLKIYKLNFDQKTFLMEIKKKKQFWNLDLKNLMAGDLPDFENVVTEISSKF